MADWLDQAELLFGGASTQPVVQPPATQPEIRAVPQIGRVEAVGRSLLQGLPLVGSWTDEAIAALEAPFSDKTYEELLAEKNYRLNLARLQYPNLTTAVELGSGFGTGGLLAKAISGATALPSAVQKVGQTIFAAPDKIGVPKYLAKEAALGSITGAGANEEDRLAGAGVGAVIQPALGGILSLGGKATRQAQKLVPTGKSLLRSSVGARYSDYLQTATPAGLREADPNFPIQYSRALEDITPEVKVGFDDETTARELFTQTQQALDRVVTAPADSPIGIGSTRNPNEMIAIISDKIKALGRSLQSVIDQKDVELAANRSRVRFPSLNQTEELLKRGNYTKEDRALITTKMADLREQFAKEGQGRLSYLQQQKQGLNEDLYTLKTDRVSKAYRSLIREMREHIEKLAPDVKAINRNISDLKFAQVPIQREVAKRGGFDLMGQVARLRNTTGGIAGASILGGTISEDRMQGAGIGGSIATALMLGNTPTGKRMLGEALLAAGKSPFGRYAAQFEAPNLTSALTGLAARRANQTEQQVNETQTPIPDTGSEIDVLLGELEKLGVSMGPAEAQAAVMPPEEVVKQRMIQRFPKASPEVREVLSGADELLQAIAYVESRGNPKAKSPKGAAGLYQFMPGTAKSLGIDPNDPAQSLDGAKRYMDKLIGRFDSDQLALAAYNWGEGNVARTMKKVAKDKNIDDWRKVSWSMIKNLAPTETQKYVPKVLALRESYITRG